MNEPLPTTPAMGEPIAYQPVSGWAVAGCAAGGLFAILVAVSTIVAVAQGAPMFFPIWILGLAAVGVVLSLMGQRHVRDSEGTRAGAKLARAGIWLSLISGVSYLTYYVFTGLAVQSQASAFLLDKTDADSGFFPRLREGATDPVQLNSAFLFTLPAHQRVGSRADNEESMLKFDTLNMDGMPGNLSHFKYGLSPSLSGSLTRIFFKQSAKDAKITELGVQDWKYEQKSYKVYRNYRVETKELEWEITLVVCSTEAESAGQGRKWYLNLGLSGVTAKKDPLPPFGEGIRALRFYAHQALQQWVDALNAGESFAAIETRDKTAWDRKIGANHLHNRALLYELFRGAGKKRIEQFKVFYERDEVGKWEEADGGRIRIAHFFRFALPKEPGQPPAYNVDGFSVHETVQAVNPAEFGSFSPPPDWNLIQIVFTSITPMPEKKGH